MFSQTPNVYGMRTRKQSSALAAANEAAQVPDSTLRTADSTAEDSSPEERRPAKTAAYTDVPANGSREASPDPDIPSYELNPPDAGSLSAGGGETASPVESLIQEQPDTWSHWKRYNPNNPADDELHTPVPRAPYRRSRSQDSPRLRAPLPTRDKPQAALSTLEPALPITSSSDPVPYVNKTIQQAEDALNQVDRERISRRYANIQDISEDTDNSVHAKYPGPSSKSKGKMPDGRNWGGLPIPVEELNPSAQEELINQYKKQTFIKPRHREQRPITPVRERSSRPLTREPTARPEDSRPIDQLPATSYLARTLENMERLRTRNMPHDRSEPSSSDSSSSDKDGHGKPPPRKPERKSRRAWKSKSRDNHRDKKTTLKPIVPKEYNGAADSRLFYRFVTEGTAYVIDGRVALDRQVFVLSYYMAGPAYDFYTQKVSMNFYDWTLSAFFEALFNYCFPVNYRMVQRDKLKRAFQNDKLVSAYVHELEELFNLIGSNNERDHVIKLWNGLRTSIQQALWRDGYNPEISSWDNVVNHAETIEISENITGSKNTRSQNDSRSHKNSNTVTGGGNDPGSNDQSRS